MKKSVISKVSLLLICLGITINVSAQQPFKIYYDVPFIPQPTNVYCWSSSIAMILWWKQNEHEQASTQESLTPTQVAVYNDWWNYWFPKGLDYKDQRPFEAWKFTTLAPQSMTLDGFRDILSNSPIWIAYDGCTNPLANCGHSVVVVGATSDGTEAGTTLFINDPDDGSGVYPNKGVRDRKMLYTEFTQRMEHWATRVIDFDRSQNGGEQKHSINFMAYIPR